MGLLSEAQISAINTSRNQVTLAFSFFKLFKSTNLLQSEVGSLDIDSGGTTHRSTEH